MRHLYQSGDDGPMNPVKVWIYNNMPVGYSWTGEIGINLAGLLFSILYAVAIFRLNFQTNLDEAGIGADAIRVVSDGFVMPPFRDNVGTGMYMFLAFILAQFVWIGIHYYYHYVGVSRCIYTIRRIPARMELHRRCCFFPVLTMIIYAGVAAAVLWMNYRAYMEVIPAILLKK